MCKLNMNVTLRHAMSARTPAETAAAIVTFSPTHPSIHQSIIHSPHNPKVPVMDVIVFVMDCPTSSLESLLRCPLNYRKVSTSIVMFSWDLQNLPPCRQPGATSQASPHN